MSATTYSNNCNICNNYILTFTDKLCTITSQLGVTIGTFTKLILPSVLSRTTPIKCMTKLYNNKCTMNQ